MKKRIVYFIAVLTIICVSAGFAQQNGTVDINVKNIRNAYYRNENVTFDVDIINNSSEKKSVTVTAILKPLKLLQEKLIIPTDKPQALQYYVRCSDLKPGEYNLDILLKDGTTNISKEFPVYISEPPNPQRLPVHYWGSSSSYIDWGIEHGFNTFQAYFIRPIEPGSKTETEHHKNFNKAIRRRVNLGGYFYTVHNSNYHNHPEVYGIHRSEEGITIDNQDQKKLCLNKPFITDHSVRTIHDVMQRYGEYPSFFQALINSEFRSDPCYCDICRAILKKETGLDIYDHNVDPLHPPKTEAEAKKAKLPEKLVKAVPINGIIKDDNPFYRYYMWFWKRGMGDVLLNERLSNIIHDYNPEVITWHDPFRLAPIYGRHKGLDCIGQWTYTHPDPKYTLYVETLIAGAKPEKQKVMPDMTTWVYQNWAAPTDSGVVFQHPDILRENCWIALSRRSDIICHYIPSRMNPSKDIEPWRRPPESFEMMSWMADNVYKPYGPFILQMERVPRKAAILNSASSVLYEEQIDRGGWTNLSLNDLYSILSMIHLPTDVVFDEIITTNGLEGYDTLFLFQCETLTRSVYEKILAFKRRGGTVIADKVLRAPIPVDWTMPFNCDHRKKQLADLVLKGEGVTADEDREIMSHNAAELLRALDGKVERYVDSKSDEVIMNVLRHGPVNYIFLVNDRRTYGERFGRFKTFHEKGVKQSVTASFYPKLKNPILYNIREHRRIPVEYDGKTTSFTVELGPCDGNIVAVYPSPIEKLVIDNPEVLTRGETGAISISVVDSEGESYGTQPLYISIIDSGGEETAYTDYYATINGTYLLEIVPALNDLEGTWTVFVRDLTSGIDGSSSLVVE